MQGHLELRSKRRHQSRTNGMMFIPGEQTKQKHSMFPRSFILSQIKRKCSAVGKLGPSSVPASAWRPEEGQGCGGSESLCQTAQGTWAENVCKEEWAASTHPAMAPVSALCRLLLCGGQAWSHTRGYGRGWLGEHT